MGDCTNPDHADPQHWRRNSRWCIAWSNGAPHLPHDLEDDHGDTVEHCEGRPERAATQSVEARLAVAEWEANAYRNQVQALVREMQRMSESGFQEPIGIIILDGRPVADESDDGKALDEARQWARHGYEIGQQHCGWTDHGTAPAWLTEGWPPHIDSCEHAGRAAEYDTTLSRVRTLAAKRLDEDECSPQERDGYHDAMRMVLTILDAAYEGRPVMDDPDPEVSG